MAAGSRAKVFVHFEAPHFAAQCEWTWRASTDAVDSDTARALLQAALEAYAAKHGTPLGVDEHQLQTSTGRAIPLDQPLHKALGDSSTDLFVVRRAASSSAAAAPAAPAPVTEPVPATLMLPAPATSRAVTVTAVTTTASTAAPSNRELAQLLATRAYDVATKNKLLQALEHAPRDVRILRALGTLYAQAGRHDTARKYFESALAIEPRHVETRIRLAESMFHQQPQADAEGAVEILSAIMSQQPVADPTRVTLARALRKAGRDQQALALYSDILQLDKRSNDAVGVIQEGNFEAVLDYGILSAERGDISHALAVFLRLVTRQADHEGLGVALGKLLADSRNLAHLEDPILRSPESLAYIALIVKEHGAIEANLKLNEMALAMKPDSTAYALALLHAYELMGKGSQALLIAKSLLKRWPQLTIGAISCTDVLTHWTTPTPPPAPPQPWLPYEPGQPDKKHPYTAEQLDLLGIWFTTIKLLFFAGEMPSATRLVRLLKPLRDGFDLHLTNIRNEQAYFACIYELLVTAPEGLIPGTADELAPQLKSNALRRLHVIGDSHTCTLSWRKLRPNWVCVGLLATGVKCWHLRPESDFYPKMQFYRLLTLVPDGARVVFMIGEIDCREGMLDAVQKCRYETLDEAMNRTVDIYITVLRQLHSARKFIIYVHPANPVLPETRQVVLAFNEHLRERVMAIKELHWLDGIADNLLNSSGELCEMYKLDGTHVNPKYLSLLEASLEQAGCR